MNRDLIIQNSINNELEKNAGLGTLLTKGLNVASRVAQTSQIPKVISQSAKKNLGRQGREFVQSVKNLAGSNKSYRQARSAYDTARQNLRSARTHGMGAEGVQNLKNIVRSKRSDYYKQRVANRANTVGNVIDKAKDVYRSKGFSRFARDTLDEIGGNLGMKGYRTKAMRAQDRRAAVKKTVGNIGKGAIGAGTLATVGAGMAVNNAVKNRTFNEYQSF